MVWPNFDGKPYSRAQLAAHVGALDFSKWRRKDGSHGTPNFITLHNTSEPTIAQWLSWAPQKRQSYIANVQDYYENKLGWRGGPHYFVPPQADIAAFGFNDPTTCGTHCSCFNSDSIGIEMVGEFNVEAFDSGPGALVRNNAVYLMGLLYQKIGVSPDTLRFHIECKADNHDCPGRHVDKADIIARVRTQIAQASPAPVPIAAPPAPVVSTQRFTGIKATVFGGHGDPNTSAYDGHPINDQELGVALPARVPSPRPKVRVTCGNRFVTCNIIDVGPWNISDPYWVKGARPQAESGKDMRGRKTNRAGIDLTPAAAHAIGIDGDGIVDWEFV